MGAKMKCRVCGKEYDACFNAKRIEGVYHWRDVACSPECGEIYLARVLESRKPNVEPVETEIESPKETENTPKKKRTRKKQVVNDE